MISNSSNDFLYDLGRKLYKIRHDRDEKLETVAKGVGVSHSVVSKIENGRYSCLSLKLLLRMSDYYGAELKTIIGD
jgi:transcriptional regulator with XRE-family HTH domain